MDKSRLTYPVDMAFQRTVRKTESNQQPNQIVYEVAGLSWLSDAYTESEQQSCLVVPVLNRGKTWLEEPRLVSVSPTKGAAEEFGRRLAHLHATGANHFGAAPTNFTGPAWIGRAPLPLIHPQNDQAPGTSWGEFYSKYRIKPYLDGPFSSEEKQTILALCTKLESGQLDHPQPALVASSTNANPNDDNANHAAARIHGDLWNGNLLWTPDGVTLIDPAAQGGHAEEDIGFLSLFGAPFFDRIVGAYNEVSPFASGWRNRVELHQMHVLMVHSYLFGRSYVGQTVEVATHYLHNDR